MGGTLGFGNAHEVTKGADVAEGIGLALVLCEQRGRLRVELRKLGTLRRRHLFEKIVQDFALAYSSCCLAGFLRPELKVERKAAQAVRDLPG